MQPRGTMQPPFLPLLFIGYYATRGTMQPITLRQDYHSYWILCNPLAHYLVLCNLYIVFILFAGISKFQAP